MDLPSIISLDEALFQIESRSSKKVLFGGERVLEISSYVAGWMASRGMDVVVLDGANRFDPYTVSLFARRVFIPPEKLLKSIRIARAFTCYQMAALMGEKLTSFVRQEDVTTSTEKPWVILLGPLTTFLDEDVPERDAGPLLERSLRKTETLTVEGVSFLLFQPFLHSHSKRADLMRKLFQFSNLIWRVHLDDEGPKVMLEKAPKNINENCKLQNEKCKFPGKILPL